MPHYELIAIARHSKDYAAIRDLVRVTALHIMDHGGHVRNIQSWGTQPLPESMTKQGAQHTVGDYFTVQFDCSPVTLKTLSTFYTKNPGVIRATPIKLGESISRISKDPSKTIGWGSDPAYNVRPRPSLIEQDRLARLTAASTPAPFIPAPLERPSTPNSSLLRSVMANSSSITDERATLASQISGGRGKSAPSMGLNENAARAARERTGAGEGGGRIDLSAGQHSGAVRRAVEETRNKMRLGTSRGVDDLFKPRAPGSGF